MRNKQTAAWPFQDSSQMSDMHAVSRPESDEHTSKKRCAANAVGPIIGIALAVLFLLILIMAAVPPTSRDALTHHLAVPKLWIEHGGMVALPDLIFSYYPMNLDLLYTVSLLFGNDIIPAYIHMLFALGTAWLIYDFLYTRSSRQMAMLGALLFLSVPVIIKLSISAYVDLGLVFFSWAAIVCLCRWARKPHSWRHLFAAAIFCGLGMGTKYNGLIVFVLLALMVPAIYLRTIPPDEHRLKHTIGYPLAFALIAMVVFSPWMIRNILLKGNPVYPLYDEIINSNTDNRTISNLSMKPWMQRKLIYHESFAETALIPLRIFFQGRDDDPRLFDGKLNPLLLLGPLLLLIPFKATGGAARLEQWFIAGFALFFLLYATFMVDMRIRYVSPIIPPLVVLSILGIAKTLNKIDTIFGIWKRRCFRGVLISTILVCLAMNAGYAGALFESVDPLPYLSGEMSRENYLSDHLPDYPAIKFANQIPAHKIKILALFLGNRRYYFDQPVRFGNEMFARMVTSATGGERLSTELQRDGFTHCLIGVGHFEAWVARMLDTAQKTVVTQWLREDCRLLFAQNGYVVMELKQTGIGDR